MSQSKSLAATCAAFCNLDQDPSLKGIRQTDFYDHGEKAGKTGTQYTCNIGVDECPIPEIYSMCQSGKEARELLKKFGYKLGIMNP